MMQPKPRELPFTTAAYISAEHTLHRAGQNDALQLQKRIFDLIVALLLSPLALLIIIPLWFIVRCDGGTGFFSHTRIGRQGIPFRCWKIRSMKPDSEVALQKILTSNPEAFDQWTRSRKLMPDPRVTRIGGFLRRTSLDEIPQLWNVFLGDMSLVGPRPVTQEELILYGEHQSVYHSMRPGLTGLWQISARNQLSYDERVMLDVKYAHVSGLYVDVKILIRTILVVLRRTGI